MLKTIRIIAKERTTHDKKKTFLVFSYLNSKGQWFNIKFKATCECPKERGIYLINVDSINCNISYDKEYDSKTIWISKVESLARDLDFEKELELKAAKEVADALS